MYLCPLCTNEVHCQGFGSLDSLRAHLDLFHCTVTSGAIRRQSSVLTELESRIEKLVNIQLSNTTDQFAPRRTQNFTGIHPAGGLLGKFAHEFDLASAENEVLKRKFGEDARKWNSELDKVKGKYGQLERQFRNLTQILETACKQQTEGKKKLETFVGRLLNDVNWLEKQLEEANAPRTWHPAEDHQAPHTRDQPRYMNTIIRPGASRRKFSNSSHSDMTFRATDTQSRLRRTHSAMDMSGRRTMRHSDIGTDSGIEDRSMFDKTSGSGRGHMSGSVTRYESEDRQDDQDAQSTIFHDTEYAYEEPAFVSYFDNQHLEMEEQPGQWKANTSLDTNSLALVLIFQHLDALDLMKCALVCRKWHAMARHPLAWRTVRLKNRALNNKVLMAISTWCSQTKKLTLENVKMVSGTEIHRPHGGSRKISFSGSLENGVEEILKSCKDKLLFLKIVACAPFITDRTLWLAACYCKDLRRVLYISDKYPANAPSIWALGASCRMLDTLIVPPLRPFQANRSQSLIFDDEALLMIARCFPTTLKVLCLGGRHITVTGLTYIAKSCQWLEALELDHCTDISLRAARSLCASGLKSLQVLNFTHCTISVSALKYFCGKTIECIASGDHIPQIKAIRVVFSWRDFPTSKHLESFLSDCQILVDHNESAKRILRLDERL